MENGRGLVYTVAVPWADPRKHPEGSMPRTSRTTSQPPPQEIEPPEDEREAVEPEVPDDVMRVLEQLGGDVSKVAIYRRGERGGKIAYVETMGADEFDLDDVKRRHGGGTYQARFHAPDGKVILSKDFSIDGAAAAAAAPASASGNGALTLQKLLDMALPVALPLLIQRLLGPREPGTDPMQVALKISEQLNNGNTAMMERLEKIIAKHERGDGSQVMETFLRGLEMGRELRDGDDPALRLGERALDLLQHGAASQPTAPKPQLPPAKGPAAAPEPSMPAPLASLAPYVSTLLKWASEGRDPETYAWVLLDEMPAHLHPSALQVCETPGAADLIVNAVPPMGPHREWLATFIEAMGNALSDSHGGPGDDDDVSGHGRDGAAGDGERPATTAG